MRETISSLAIPVNRSNESTRESARLMAEYALIADAPEPQAKPQSRRALQIAIAAAFLLHLAVLGFFLVGSGGEPPQLRELGAEQGMPDNLNVAVVSEADLKSMSMDPFRQEQRLSQSPPKDAPPPVPEETKAEEQPTPQPQPPQPQPPQPQEPQKQEVKEADASAATKQAKPNDKPYDPAGFAAKAAEEFSQALNRALNSPAQQRQTAQRSIRASANVRLFRPAAARSGKSDEFERQVVWALAATKPIGNGKFGISRVTFTISMSGQLEEIRLTHSSGDNWLDTGALMAVRQARLPVPPSGLTQGDRTFNVEYISIDGG